MKRRDVSRTAPSPARYIASLHKALIGVKEKPSLTEVNEGLNFNQIK